MRQIIKMIVHGNDVQKAQVTYNHENYININIINMLYHDEDITLVRCTSNDIVSVNSNSQILHNKHIFVCMYSALIQNTFYCRKNGTYKVNIRRK